MNFSFGWFKLTGFIASDTSDDMKLVGFAPSETSDGINPVSLPRPKHRMA